MALINLKTDLKSLKYGNDTSGGGDSSQPYIQIDINNPLQITGIKRIDEAINRVASKTIGIDDGFVRGGVLGAAKASVYDTIRIGKFFTDVPRGPLFIAKQVGLQLSNPKLEVKKGVTGLLTGLLAGDLGPATNGLLEPTRVYNLGFNTLAQIPATAFGIHFNRHGLTPEQNESTKYAAVVKANNESGNNRLILLKDKLIKEPLPFSRNKTVGAIFQFLTDIASKKLPFLNPKNEVIDDYLGGPGSIYGIGYTTIRKFDNTSNTANKIPIPSDNSKEKNGDRPPVVDYSYTLGVSKQYFGGTAASSFGTTLGGLLGGALSTIGSLQLSQENTGINVGSPTTTPNQLTQTAVTYSLAVGPSLSNNTKKYQDLINQINNQQQLKKNTPNQFGIYNAKSKAYRSNSVGNITYKNTYGETITSKFNNWAAISRERRVGSGRQDEINLTPIFDSLTSNEGPTLQKKNDIRDLVRFRICAIDANNISRGKWMVFRAYLTQFSDSVDAAWSDIKYTGRGDKFYVYDGFTRRINIGFKVATLSADEMKFVYSKLNFLMSNLMPDYSEDTLMRGPLVRMSVGGWIDNQPGIINSLNYTVPNDSPWEISLDSPEGGTQYLILPHVVEVSMTFTPIGSQTRGSNLIPKKDLDTSHIAQNNTGNIGLQYVTSSLLITTR